MASPPSPQPQWLPPQLTTSPSPTIHALTSSLLPPLLRALSQIGLALRSSHRVSLAGSANSFGDDQLNVDVACEAIMRAALAQCPLVASASSEEDPEEKQMLHQDEPSGAVTSQERFSVAFDPLDGSSIIAANWTVGTIVGVWKGETALGKDPREQVCSLMGVHGPRTTVIVAVRDSAEDAEGVCFELGLDDDGSVEVIRPNVKLSAPPYKTRYFAPANLRHAADSPAYATLISSFIAKKYTLRYCGGLVPDLGHVLNKGHGVYVSPVAEASKAKLRRLYEVLPVALAVECAGGRAVDEEGRRVLERRVGGCDERGGIIFGNEDEVEEVVRVLFG
ncbi:fructose-1-6-bisphosphatase [Trichoderma citrinoviride]|uniref:Fructose-1-6-bisphosphatase n=1 Tax=Trichoderma citrinoviride TaxID=58853 RepID=A0A2T4B2F9_9HYPO|nr:fructose-1-6-bisphosphatase [Trichoderma citrinoviride]PTB63490.1 fructose-1-6-bisphosphatase [Trichoderma citrinoviride]